MPWMDSGTLWVSEQVSHRPDQYIYMSHRNISAQDIYFINQLQKYLLGFTGLISGWGDKDRSGTVYTVSQDSCWANCISMSFKPS